MVADTGIVREKELRVARMSGGRFLIHHPRGLTVASFIQVIPPICWD